MTKDEARIAALARRKEAYGKGRDASAQAVLLEALAPHRGRILAGYMPIRTEIDPLPVMARWDAPVAVPVIRGPGRPLDFHLWSPEAAMIDGPFGARVPAIARPVRPDVLIVPLVAFDAKGFRLGYGGGYYDRTLERLRKGRGVTAIGFAFAAQEIAEVPVEPTDQRLDLIATEAGVVAPRK